MSDSTITCPHCHQAIQLNDALSHQLDEQLKAERARSEAEMERQRAQLAAEKAALDTQLAERLEVEKRKLWETAQQKAEEKITEKFSVEMRDLKAANEEKEAALRKAREEELTFRKKTRELEEAKAAMELDMARRMDEERRRVADEEKRKAGEEHRMKLLEKDKQMEQMRTTIEELRRKSEQGSMQIQGDVQENDLKRLLIERFPLDTIDDVPTGIRGADLVQTVRTRSGRTAGVILWESKNTKTWSNDWLKKLKDDQGLAKADICVLVSQALPEGIHGFGQIDGIWVSDYASVGALITALRFHVIELAGAKSALVGREEKMEVLFNYLTSAQFKNRVEVIVGAFQRMQADLEAEKRSMKKHWAKREKEIERVIDNTVGMHGDLQGFIGTALPSIAALELSESEEVDEEEEALKLL